MAKIFSLMVNCFGSAFTRKVHWVSVSNRNTATVTHSAISILKVSVVEANKLGIIFRQEKKKSLTKTALLFSVQMLTLLNWKRSPPSSHFVGDTSALINDLFYTCNQTIKYIEINFKSFLKVKLTCLSFRQLPGQIHHM